MAKRERLEWVLAELQPRPVGRLQATVSDSMPRLGIREIRAALQTTP